VHAKTIGSQEIRPLLVARKQLLGKLLDVELSIRGILRGFGLKVGQVTADLEHSDICMALGTSTNDSLRMLRGGCRSGSEMNRPLEIKMLPTVGATRRPIPYEILGRIRRHFVGRVVTLTAATAFNAIRSVALLLLQPGISRQATTGFRGRDPRAAGRWQSNPWRRSSALLRVSSFMEN
jgi:hypothetical protein